MDDQTLTVDETARSSDSVGQVKATDPDPADTLKFSFHSTDTPDVFSISSTGAVSVKANTLNYESKNSYTYGVTVSDGTNSVKKTLTIKVTDQPDAPVVSAPSKVLTVNENSAANTKVGTAMVATDEDAGDVAKLTWSMSTNDYFKITTGGQILVKSPPDFESIKSSSVTVVAKDPSGMLGQRSISISINDVNESPVIAATQSRSVAEAVAVGSKVGNPIVASDPDGGQSLFFSIVSGSDNMFSIDSLSGQIRVAQALDHETKSKYTLSVKVQDSGSPSKSATGAVVITVTDSDEAPTLADRTLSIAENSVSGTKVGAALPAKDPEGSAVNCKVDRGNTGDIFTFASGTCQLQINNPPDYESQKEFTLVVSVLDGVEGDANTMTGTGTVTVKVTDVNEPPAMSGTAFTRAISDSAKAGDKIGVPFIAIDPDAGQKLKWTVRASDQSTAPSTDYTRLPFTIDSTSGQLKVLDDLVALPAGQATAEVAFSIIATDDGSPAKSVTQEIVVDLTSGNKPPVAKAGSASLSEDASAGTTLSSNPTCSDPDDDTVQFFIDNGNTGDVFSIDSTTGKIKLASSLDYETKSSYKLTIRCTDVPGTDAQGNSLVPMSSSATWTVLVKDVNEAPTLDASTFSVAENSAADTVVGTVAGTDPDAKDTLKYSITSGNTGTAFKIASSSNKGTISVNKASLNYERIPTYSLVITVTDAKGKTDTATVQIQITDKNDAPVLAAPTAAQIPESSSRGTTVGGGLSATDEDGDSITFMIASGNTDSTFSLSTTGVLTLAKEVDYETTSRYNLKVKAVDEAGLSNTKTWTIFITNVNEKPSYTGPTSVSVDENQPKDELIFTAKASDPDADDTLTYSLAGGSTAFYIDEDTGAVKALTATSINYEQAALHNLKVVVTDSSGLSASTAVKVTVNNVNEPPTISTTSLELPETAVQGDLVGTVVVTDEDTVDNHTLSISSGNGDNNDWFSVDGMSIYLDAAKIDYEKKNGALNKFSLSIKVTDTGSPTKSATGTLVIDVTDRNEKPSILPQTRTVDENSGVNTLVGDVLDASDPDVGQSLSFKIVSGNPGFFKIDACSGQIKVSQAGIDYEKLADVAFHYNLTVSVTDDAGPVPGPARLSDQAIIKVRINDVNEPPSVVESTAEIAELSDPGSLVGTAVKVLDEDFGQTHSFTISGGNSDGAFKINAKTGQISIKNGTKLDHETEDVRKLNVTASDSGKPTLTGSGIITVTILDANEPPILDDQTISLAENSAEGALVGSKLAAKDPDEGQTVSYRLSGGADMNMFKVSSDGQITVGSNATLDFESDKNVLVIEVTATDSADIPLSDAANITIKLTNVNENPVLKPKTLSIKESASVATAVEGSADLATDVDANDRHTYSIVSQEPAGFFRILASDGSLEVKLGLNYEEETKHSVRVRVADAGGLYAEADMTITIVDVNEAPEINDQTRQIDENLNSEKVGPVMVAKDVDAADIPYENLVFSLLSTDDSSKFTINGTTGQISTASDANLDYETKGTYSLKVKVADQGGLSDTAQVSVTVVDVNEAPTTSKQSYAFQASENAKKNQEVGRISASDQDSMDSLSYSISWTTVPVGASSSDLAIESSTGRIYVAKASPASPSDYMPQNETYEGIVTVTDDGAGFLKTTASVAVLIIPYNDPPTLSGASFSLDENSRVGTLVGYVLGTDADSEDTLTYSITGGNFADAFKISTVPGAKTGDRRRGEIRVQSNIIDFETRNSYDLTVRVSDGRLQVTAQVDITINDLGENPEIDSSSLTMDLDENPASIGAVIGTVKATDVDAADSEKLQFSFFGDGNAKGHFSIDKDTGNVKVASLDIDRETISSYKIGVLVKDTYNLTDSRNISIAVNNVNDAPVLNDLTVSVDENLDEGETVTSKVRATDQDSSDLISYKMGRPLCWSATVSSVGAKNVEYAPISMSPSDSAVSFEASMRIRASSDVIVHLRAEDTASGDKNYVDPTGDFYELHIGVSSNSKTQLRKCPSILSACYDMHKVAEATTQGILNSREDVDMWVAIVGSKVMFGTGYDRSDAAATTLLTYDDPASFDTAPTRIGIGSGKSKVQATAVCFENSDFVATDVFTVTSSGDVEIGSSSPNYEAQRWYGFEIIATDSGKPERSDRAVVQININDVNEQLQWTESACRLA